MNQENSRATCPDGSGTMPSCAPLAVPYVPFQQEGSQKYSKNEALNQGTLFPGLNLPFQAKPKAADVVKGPLTELQTLEFVLQELVLYLDTHPDDQEAFALFQQYAALEQECRQRYQSRFGPLTANAAAARSRYTWNRGPWPWNETDKEAE
ncbi:MAG: spore coat protein CotJB [Oscillospiraceae bacterium]|nr:spore coat protein CotJB [Oscillospiraceae bacterium]